MISNSDYLVKKLANNEDVTGEDMSIVHFFLISILCELFPAAVEPPPLSLPILHIISLPIPNPKCILNDGVHPSRHFDLTVVLALTNTVLLKQFCGIILQVSELVMYKCTLTILFED
jgi:hypothetical protein